MSTLSSLVHVNGSSLGHDLCRTLSQDKLDSRKITRIGVVLGIIGSIAVAYIFPPGIVARGTAIFFGVCAAAFLPAYFAALYWKRATRIGVWASVVTGSAVSIFGLTFMHISESKALGICKLVTGKDVLFSQFPWPFVDTLCYALPLSAVVLVVVSLCTAAPDKEHINKCFDK